jgi:hypothetical protein
MTRRVPPRIALWVAERCGASYEREAFVGDLIEQFQQGESRWWLWKQVMMAVVFALAGAARAARSLLKWAWRRQHASALVKHLVAALASLALGWGALTWAATTQANACQSEQCVCSKSH